MKIFVSYTTLDNDVTVELLNSLSNSLSNLGIIYIDLIHNDSFDKQARVLYEIDRCDCFLLLQSDKIDKSNWVKIEVERARLRQKPIKKILLSELKNGNFTEILQRLLATVKVEAIGL